MQDIWDGEFLIIKAVKASPLLAIEVAVAYEAAGIGMRLTSLGGRKYVK